MAIIQIFSLIIYNKTESTVIDISADNEYINIVDQQETMNIDNIQQKSKLEFKVTTTGTCNSIVTINIHDDNYVFTKEITIRAFDTLPYSYTVEDVEGSTYGFILNDDGYYESNNKGQDASSALCKVNIINKSGYNVFIDCINYAEPKCDYGILSNINKTLSIPYNNVDNPEDIKKSFKTSNSSDIQTVEYGAVDGFIYVKYIKDISTNIFNDSLQFKVRFE